MSEKEKKELKVPERLGLERVSAMVWDEMKKLREGASSVAVAQVIINGAGKIQKNIETEMQFAKLTGQPAYINLDCLDEGEGV